MKLSGIKKGFFILSLGGVVAKSFAMPLQVEDCPSVSVIQGEGIHMAQPLVHHLFVVYHYSKFNTDNTWLFGVGLVTGDSMADAIQNGNRLVQNMSPVPVLTQDKNAHLTCFSPLNNSQQMAVAVLADYVKTPEDIQNLFARSK